VEFNFEKMETEMQAGFMNAWAAATYLVRKGVPFRLAHEQVGKAVQMCIDTCCELKDLSLDQLRTINSAFDEDFYPSITLGAVLSIHDVLGGTAPERVAQAIAAARLRTEAMEEVHAHA